MKERKKYVQVWGKMVGKRVLLYRKIVGDLLARPLLLGEIVYHRNGNSTNNAPENLIVLASQQYHTHVEHHLRCDRRGMPNLFPNLLSQINAGRRGTLFESILCL